MGWVRERVEDIPFVGPIINDITETVSRVATAPFEATGFNDLAERFIDDPVQAISDDLAKFDDVVLQPVTAPISKLGTQIDDKVNEAIPGGWATVAQIALSFAAPGLGTALGTAVLGAGASTFAAATLGGAMLGAGTGALTASLRGGDPLKGALAGAAGGAFGGAVSSASMDIATNIVGMGNAAEGLATLKSMSAATGISVTKLANVVSNSVASGIAGAASGKGDVGTLIGTSLVASGVGAYAGSIVNGLDPGQLNTAVNATASIANIGTRAALGGNDIGDAIVSQAPTILANSVFSELRPTINSATKSITDDISSLWGKNFSDLGYKGDDDNLAITKPPLAPPETLAIEEFQKINQEADDIYRNSIEPLSTAAKNEYNELQKIGNEVAYNNTFLDNLTNEFNAQKQVVEGYQAGWIPRSKWENPSFGDPAYQYAKWDGQNWSYASSIANAVPPQERQKLLEIGDLFKEVSNSSKSLEQKYQDKLFGYTSLDTELKTAQENYDKTVAQITKTQEDAWAKQLADALANPAPLTGPTGLVAGPGTGIVTTPTSSVTLSNDTESNEIVKPGNVIDTSHLDVIPDNAYKQPDGTFLDPETGIKYIPNDDGTVTTINPSDEPVVNPSPLTPNPADQKDAETYFQALLTQGIEPALATKMSGYTPAGTGTLPSDGTGTPTGTPDGTPDGTGTGRPDGTGTLPVVTPPSPLTPPLSTVPTAPTNPDLTAGELIVEGTVPKPYEPFESDFPTQPDTTAPPVTTKPPVTTPTIPIKIPTTTPTTTTTTTTPKPTGALPTATDSSFSMPSTGAQTTPAVTAPLSISATSLAGAPVYNNNPQLLAELKQMYPQLSTINPKLLNMLGASPQGTPPLSQSAQVAKAQDPNEFMTKFMGKGISTDLDLPSFAGGGHIHGMEYGHVPQFITGATGNYVKGRGDGQSDDIPAMLADGEYVFDADTVAQLGNGSSDAGAKLLDHFRHSLREHKRSAPVDKIPPKASPLAYMKEALKRHSEG